MSNEDLDRMKQESDFRRGDADGQKTDGPLDIAANVIGNLFESDAYREGYDHGLGQPKG